MKPSLVKVSKFLSLVLRHQPQLLGLHLDAQGWTSVKELLQRSQAGPHPMTLELLQAVVHSNDKQRFAFSPDGTLIRANQGHSVEVDLALPPVAPPEVLYHGTASTNLTSIGQRGLLKGRRHHVHLSVDPETATKVGQRHGPSVVLSVRAGEMHRIGHVFFQSANGVWLTEQVPPAFLEFP